MSDKNTKIGRLPQFSWAVGIEDTFVPQAKPGMRALEEYELTQHYQFWRQDLDNARALGVTRMRWGVPWYRVETEPSKFDWQWVDEVLGYMAELGIEPIVDIMHYGTPLWLEDSFNDPRYPELVARFAREFTQRYEHIVKDYVPLNEPTVNSDFSGRRAQWPPYLSGDAGYVRVLLQITRGIQASAKAIREVKPDAVLFAVEAMCFYSPATDASKSAAELCFSKDLLCFDMVEGTVDERHPLYQWLLDRGATGEELSSIRQNAITYDVCGVNFYPWSSKVVQTDGSTVPGKDDGRRMLDVIRKVYAHAKRPLFVTETSAVRDRRAGWMQEVIDAVMLARAEGDPVIGFTWFPLFTMIDWDYRTSDQPIEKYLLDLGLLDARFEEGKLVRRPTKLVSQFRECMRQGMPPVDLNHKSWLVRLWYRIWCDIRGVKFPKSK